MNDINKIRIIHDLKSTFVADDEIINKFIDQIEGSNLKDNIERFFKGYSIENNFHFLFSALPWVKLVHGLEQNQLPNKSKETYQVPDFSLYFETSKKEIKPALLEVKSVKGDKQNLEIMEKQLGACLNYSKILNIPFMYAVYWEKFQMWTVNAIENFELKTKKYKINIFEALKNDMSIIFGDITFLLNFPIYRRTKCDRSAPGEGLPMHAKFGPIIQESISIDNIKFIDITPIESAIIDSSIKMTQSERKTNGSITEFSETSDYPNILKLSILVLRYLAIFRAELNAEFTDISRRIIIEFLKKIKAVESYSIPNVKTSTSDLLYQQAFEGTPIWDKYLIAHK